MSPTTGTSEEIIEKRDSSPFATSCLILAVLAVLGAIFLQLKELSALGPSNVDKVARGVYAREVEQEIRAEDEEVNEALNQAEAAMSERVLSKIEEVLGQPIEFPAAAGGADEEGLTGEDDAMDSDEEPLDVAPLDEDPLDDGALPEEEGEDALDAGLDDEAGSL